MGREEQAGRTPSQSCGYQGPSQLGPATPALRPQSGAVLAVLLAWPVSTVRTAQHSCSRVPQEGLGETSVNTSSPVTLACHLPEVMLRGPGLHPEHHALHPPPAVCGLSTRLWREWCGCVYQSLPGSRRYHLPRDKESFPVVLSANQRRTKNPG